MSEQKQDVGRAAKRLMKELQKLSQDPLPFATVSPASDDDILVWHAVLHGPSKTPYHTGYFLVELRCSPDYPISCPKVRFLTPVFHPNVDMKDQGRLCADVLEKNWAPVLSIRFSKSTCFR
jgi:ubiquitin-protein ligase